ncbi:MAG: rod shape-determining protein RodA, partial [Gammaproteobacteria bacterium]|nr:rod shape-determining protein RodA [Gammaproteobacteria bacterium]
MRSSAWLFTAFAIITAARADGSGPAPEAYIVAPVDGATITGPVTVV